MDPSNPDDTLFLTDLAASNDNDVDASQRQSCKDRLVVVHEMKEAGASRWAPWRIFLTTRLLSADGLFGLALYLKIQAPVFFMGHIYNFGFAVAFLLLVVCTALYVKWFNEQGVSYRDTVVARYFGGQLIFSARAH